MFNISYRLAALDWQERTFVASDKVVLGAYLKAIREISCMLPNRELQLLPLGACQFVIWGQGRCQGFLSIEEVGQETSAHVSESG